ncbi:expressed unknown protein [Seminavis robusta]|nr:expressed unknown protein [Seminavis robusta]|eukprot:Sro2250_g320830.1 n/a (166) ;mRNA; r:13433-13930
MSEAISDSNNNNGTDTEAPVVVNMARYNRDFVSGCIDEARGFIIFRKDRKEGAFEEGCKKLQEGLENLKLYPNHNSRQIKQSKSQEDKADDYFKEGKFEKAYKTYEKAIHSLKTRQLSPSGCACCIVSLVVIIPLMFFTGGGNSKGTECSAGCGCNDKALPKELD